VPARERRRDIVPEGEAPPERSVGGSRCPQRAEVGLLSPIRVLAMGMQFIGRRNRLIMPNLFQEMQISRSIFQYLRDKQEGYQGPYS